MRILLTGKNGMVGWELNRSLLPLGEVIAIGRDEMDFSKPDRLRDVVQEVSPDIIVNAAAYTAVDKAEKEESMAALINSEAPRVLAEEAQRIGALLVHYSTDYVFDGTKDTPYVEDDIPNPINAYGRTKLEGERAIQGSGADYLIFRTSWVYAERGNNFLNTMLRLMKEKETLSIVDDQVGAPTWARTIADSTAHCIKQLMREKKQQEISSGIYNLTNTGETSWHGFASKIAENMKKISNGKKIIVNRLEPISSNDYPTPAKRPNNSRLSTEKLKDNFSLNIPEWNYALELCVNGLKN